MTKGEQIVALAMEKVSREGYPKLTEDHPFFGRLRAFMVDKHYWMGTATDLLTEMNDTVTPTNTVTKLLNKYWYRLRKRDGIGINFRRTNRIRTLHNNVESKQADRSYPQTVVAEKSPRNFSTC